MHKNFGPDVQKVRGDRQRVGRPPFSVAGDQRRRVGPAAAGWTQTIPGVCVLAPGHAGACRSAEQVIDQLDERPLRPLTVRGL